MARLALLGVPSNTRCPDQPQRDEDAVFPTLRRAGYRTGIFGKIHNNQAHWLCTANNRTQPFDHIETECNPCGGYYRTGANEWVRKEEHDDVPTLETLDPASPFSNYSEAQYGNRTVAWIRRVVAAGRAPCRGLGPRKEAP